MKKTFDAVAMKRDAAKRIYEETAGMTLEQQLAHWQEADRWLKLRWQRLAEQDESIPPVVTESPHRGFRR